MLLDTSGLYSYFDKDDSFHDKAVKYFDTVNSMVVNDYVLAEFIPLCRVRGLNREKTLAFVEEILRSPFVEKIWTNERHYRAALTLLKTRADKNYSLCDAASFILMREYEINEALTTDKHFEQEGFIRLLKRLVLNFTSAATGFCKNGSKTAKAERSPLTTWNITRKSFRRYRKPSN